LTWADGASQADIQARVNQAQQAMISAYGPLNSSPQAAQQSAPATSATSATSAPQPSQPTSDSPITALRNSAGDLVGGLTKLDKMGDDYVAKLTGTKPNAGFDNAEQAVGPAISGSTQYKPDPLNSAGNVAKDAVGVVAGAVPYAAAALTGPVGLAAIGGSSAGNTISNRMQAKGESSPSLGDVGAGVASAALNTVGGGLAHGVMGPTARRLLGSTANSLLGRTALNTAAGAGLGAANNVLNTAGTGQMTAGGVGQAALQGAAQGGLTTPVAEGARAAAGVPGTALRAAQGALGNLGDSITAHNHGPITDSEAASMTRVNNDLSQFSDPANNIRPNAPLTSKLNGYSKALKAQTIELGNQISQLPGMPEDVSKQIIQPLVQTAAIHNGVMPPNLRAAFNGLPLDDATRTTFNNALDDLDTLSQGRMLNRQSGPFQASFSKLGGIAASAALATHSPVEALANLALGGHAENAVAGKIGGLLDRAAGTQKPLLQVMANPAAKQAAANGSPVGPSSLDATADAITKLNQVNQQAQQAAQPAQASNGNPLLPINRGNINALSQFGPDHPVGAVALDQLQQAGLVPEAANAIAKFNANQPVADAKARVKANAQAQAQQTAQDQKDAETAAARDRAVAQSNAEAALGLTARSVNKADSQAENNQVKLNAADITPQGADGVGLTAINAAANQLGRQAKSVRAAGGEVQEPDESQGAPTAAPGGSTPSPVPTAASASPSPQSGLQGLADHLSAESLWGPAGTSLSPEELNAGLAHAAAAGKLSPEQYAVLKDHIDSNTPVRNDGGRVTPALQAIMQHAVALKNGTPVPVSTPPQAPAAASGDTPVIRSPTRFANTVKTNQVYLSDLSKDGTPVIADTANALRVTKSVPDRQKIVDDAYSTLLGAGDVVTAARLRTLFRPDLIQAGKKAK
jgi:hypothetical protein